MFSKEVKEKYRSFRFDELEKYGLAYETRYYSRVIPRKRERSELMGHKGVIFLLQSLQRSKCIFDGFVDCVNLTHIVLAYLAARVHFETTGSIAYLLWHLRRFYKGEIAYREIENVLSRLALGAKTFPDKDTLPEQPEPINVLTQIDFADKLFKDANGKNLKIFRQCYDFLSEFCHPNMLGLMVGSDVTENRNLILYEKHRFREEDFGTLINHMLISCNSFFYAYDKSFSLLKDHELMPDLVKPNE
jgi:hypothetical protein